MTFSSLAGQQELRRMLTGALAADKLSHAIVLAGPSGSGKKSWGKALSQAILCANRSGAEPCMQCFSCHSFCSGNHSDYFFLEPDGRRIKIAQIRSIRNNFYLSGSKKVCLIDRAEMMTAETSSSLLKILEEPPVGLYFILLAEQPLLLFDTILSRCQCYMLQPLKYAEIIELLTRERNMAMEQASLLAHLSGGLPGNAFKLADDDQFADRFAEAKTMAGNLASGRDSALQLLSQAVSLAEREDLIPFLELICLFYRDRLIQNLCGNCEQLINPDQPSAWVEVVSPTGLEEAVLMINAAIYEIKATNANRRLLLEKTLIMLQRRLAK